MKSKLFVCMFFLALNSLAYAQTNATKKPDTPGLDAQMDLQSQLVPLDSIITIAIKHSPSIKFQQDLIDAAKSQVEFTQKQWTNNIVGFVNYSGGNQSIVSADNQSPGEISSSNISSGFRVGVQINLPLYEFAGRKSQIKVFKAQLNSTINKRDETEQGIRQGVIQFYYNLLYADHLLSIRSDAKQATVNQYEIAEKEFREGIINVSELSRLKTIEVNAEADYEDAKRQFDSLYSQIPTLIGVPVEQLIVKR